MDIEYIAVSFQPPLISSSYKEGEKRFCIISTETGEILDDAQGYGYRTPQKAYAAYRYKTRITSQEKFLTVKELMSLWGGEISVWR
jgi:hypothetical protein